MGVCVWSLSRVQVFGTPWTITGQAALFMGFSRQEYWRGLPFHTPGDLPNPRIEPASPVSLVLAGDSLPLLHLGSRIWVLLVYLGVGPRKHSEEKGKCS